MMCETCIHDGICANQDCDSYRENCSFYEPLRQKGEWIDHSETDGYVECPFCEHLTTCDGNKDELRFCWYCGAEMGGGTE